MPRTHNHRPAGIVLFGMAVGLDVIPNLEFDLNAPYAGCRLCGQLYQSPINLQAPPVANEVEDRVRRERWRELHTRRYHTVREVEAFKLTGLAFTPEAANRLAPYGIIPMADSIINEEVAAALLEAPRVPQLEVQTHP